MSRVREDLGGKKKGENLVALQTMSKVTSCGEGAKRPGAHAFFS